MSPELVWWDEADGLSLTRRAPRGATPLTGAELRDPAVWPEVTALLTRLHRAALPDGYDCAPHPPPSPSALYSHAIVSFCLLAAWMHSHGSHQRCVWQTMRPTWRRWEWHSCQRMALLPLQQYHQQMLQSGPR